MLNSILALALCCASSTHDYANLWRWQSASTAVSPDPTPSPGPTPSPNNLKPGDDCPKCEGGWLPTDGSVRLQCLKCKGDGICNEGDPILTDPLVEETPETPAPTLSADEQPTPWPGVSAALNELKPQPNEVLIDYGCGYDARLLTSACRFFNVEKAIGVEINPSIADSARYAVEDAGLSDQIEIITGDSTKLDLKADIGIAYLWPEVLSALRPKIEKLDRFVSYGFAVPGLPMTKKPLPNGGELYVWRRSTITPTPVVAPTAAKPAPASVTVIRRVPITRSYRATVRLPRGSYCTVCGGHCSNPMAHQLQRKIIGYKNILETVPAPVAKPAPSPPEKKTSAAPRYSYDTIQCQGETWTCLSDGNFWNDAKTRYLRPGNANWRQLGKVQICHGTHCSLYPVDHAER